MSDYILQVKVKNGPMLRAMRRLGYRNAADFARASGVNNAAIGRYLNLKEIPIRQDGLWRSDVMKIAEALNELPGNLFPPQHINEALDRNTAEIETSYSQLTGRDIAAAALPSPEDHLAKSELRAAIDDAISSLPDRDRDIFERRLGFYGEPETLEQIAKSHGIGKERVRQIEHRALRRLKHPSHSRKLKTLAIDAEVFA